MHILLPKRAYPESIRDMPLQMVGLESEPRVWDSELVSHDKVATPQIHISTPILTTYILLTCQLATLPIYFFVSIDTCISLNKIFFHCRKQSKNCLQSENPSQSLREGLHHIDLDISNV